MQDFSLSMGQFEDFALCFISQTELKRAVLEPCSPANLPLAKDSLGLECPGCVERCIVRQDTRCRHRLTIPRPPLAQSRLLLPAEPTLFGQQPGVVPWHPPSARWPTGPGRPLSALNGCRQARHFLGYRGRARRGTSQCHRHPLLQENPRPQRCMSGHRPPCAQTSSSCCHLIADTGGGGHWFLATLN